MYVHACEYLLKCATICAYKDIRRNLSIHYIVNAFTTTKFWKAYG